MFLSIFEMLTDSTQLNNFESFAYSRLEKNEGKEVNEQQKINHIQTSALKVLKIFYGVVCIVIVNTA